MDANERDRVMAAFRDGKVKVLITTNVIARGIDVPGVNIVINYDLPQDAQDYVHRIGRTARAGNTGDAISFACEEYVYSLPDIEAYIEHKIDAEMPHGDDFADDVVIPARRPRKRRGGPGKGGSRGRGGPRRR